jgi:hypothetical protein
MVKKFAPLFFLVVLAGSIFASDWRTEVANFFNARPTIDYRAAVAYLEGCFPSLQNEDKPTACGLLAYLYSLTVDRNNEYAKLGEYFEKYGPLGMGYNFLPLSVQADIALYLRAWQLKYPWVLKIGFVESSGITSAPFALNPPRTLVIGVEMANEVFYKLSDSKSVLKGGLFRRGFNSVTIETKKLFSGPGTYPYFLEFKAGDLIVRRELAIDVRRDSFGVMGKPAEQGKNPEFVLKMFLGDNLLASSRKFLPSTPIKVEIPPPGGKFDPFGPGYQNEPKIPPSIPIMALPTAIYDLIKSLTKRGHIEPVPPVELKPEVAFIFREKNAAGDQIEIRARLELEMRNIRFFPFALGESSQNSNR